MGTLYENIKSLCDAKGISGGKMCADIGMSKGNLTDLKKGRQAGISAVNAQKIASYFGVSVGYLLGDETEKENPASQETEQNTELSPEKQEAIDFIKNSASNAQLSALLAMMKTWQEQDENK